MKNIQFYENINPNITYTLKAVSSNWSKDQIIRYLYKELAYYVHRDLQYFLRDNLEKQRQYSMGFINRFPGVVCYTLAEFYCAGFQEFGIEAKVVQANSADIPLFGVVVRGDYGNYFLNPLEDLFLSQYGMRPNAFGFVPKYNTINNNCPNLVKLDWEYVSDLDKSLGFTFCDDYLDELSCQMKDKRKARLFFKIDDPRRDIREDKLLFMSKELINRGNIHGLFERAQLYKCFNDRLLNDGEKRHVRVAIENGLSDNPYISYTIIRSDEEIVYKEEKNAKGYVLSKKN